LFTNKHAEASQLRLLTAHAAQLRKEAEIKSKLLTAAAMLSACAKPFY
jgi:hypothetical protein